MPGGAGAWGARGAGRAGRAEGAARQFVGGRDPHRRVGVAVGVGGLGTRYEGDGATAYPLAARGRGRRCLLLLRLLLLGVGLVDVQRGHPGQQGELFAEAGGEFGGAQAGGGGLGQALDHQLPQLVGDTGQRYDGLGDVPS